jgi:hypothetical protein
MEILVTPDIRTRPKFKAKNIADVLASRDFFVDSYTAWYEELQREKLLPRIYGPAHPTQTITGNVEIPLVGHDPKRDKPDSLIDFLLFSERITLFDASAEVHPLLLGRTGRFLFEPVQPIDQPQLPTEKQLKENTWTSGVTLTYFLGKRFRRPTTDYQLTGVTNSSISGGKPILSTEARLRELGLDIKR